MSLIYYAAAEAVHLLMTSFKDHQGTQEAQEADSSDTLWYTKQETAFLLFLTFNNLFIPCAN